MNRRAIWGIGTIVMLGLLLGIWGAGAFAAPPAPDLTRAGSAQVQTNPVVRTAERSDTSRPLREIAAGCPRQRRCRLAKGVRAAGNADAQRQL